MRCAYCRHPLHRRPWVHIGWSIACVDCGYAIARAGVEVDVTMGIQPTSAGDA